MKEYKRKWNNYKIKNVTWINKNREHFCRKKFIEFIENENVKSIVEVGGGELIEAQSILSKNPTIKYYVVDISDTFLNFAKTIKGIECYNGDMVNIPIDDNMVDLFYCSSVLEHSPDIYKTVKEMSRISNRFYFNMFTWKMKTGNLKSTYHANKKYYSTIFNIDMLLDLIVGYGNIEHLMIYGKDGGEEHFEEYRKNNSNIDINRNGSYLSINGIWNK